MIFELSIWVVFAMVKTIILVHVHLYENYEKDSEIEHADDDTVTEMVEGSDGNISWEKKKPSPSIYHLKMWPKEVHKILLICSKSLLIFIPNPLLVFSPGLIIHIF